MQCAIDTFNAVHNIILYVTIAVDCDETDANGTHCKQLHVKQKKARLSSGCEVMLFAHCENVHWLSARFLCVFHSVPA